MIYSRANGGMMPWRALLSLVCCSAVPTSITGPIIKVHPRSPYMLSPEFFAGNYIGQHDRTLLECKWQHQCQLNHVRSELDVFRPSLTRQVPNSAAYTDPNRSKSRCFMVFAWVFHGFVPESCPSFPPGFPPGFPRLKRSTKGTTSSFVTDATRRSSGSAVSSAQGRALDQGCRAPSSLSSVLNAVGTPWALEAQDSGWNMWWFAVRYVVI